MPNVIGVIRIWRPKFILWCDVRHQEVQRVGVGSRGNPEERQEAVRPTYVLRYLGNNDMETLRR